MRVSVRVATSLRNRRSFHSDSKLPPGSQACKCAACGAYFKNERAFHRHRVGRLGVDRCCAQKAHMSKLGLTFSAGMWHLPKRPFSAERRQELDGRLVEQPGREACVT